MKERTKIRKEERKKENLELVALLPHIGKHICEIICNLLINRNTKTDFLNLWGDNQFFLAQIRDGCSLTVFWNTLRRVHQL
jgi:hypothetical protein